ncbi:MAG: uncharacterized protein PWQ67_2733 [Clostridia bacterium]|jgi:hypothetical protein|nr:uncharacterized protein [Clostridiales bacterium]MDN5324279.1 uncharacterized protein [Clostridia bacterium]
MNVNNCSEVFEDLKDLGFDNLTDISIYNAEDKIDKNKKNMNSMEGREENYLFDRKLKCPVCESNITVRAVKSSSIRIISRDTDFMIYYKDPNPLFYDAWVCTQCGYSAISSQFYNISEAQKKVVREKVCSKWKQKSYGHVYTIDTAIERYKLALLTSVVKNTKTSERALMCIKLAWLYRLKKDSENENKFLSLALQGFINAFEKEQFPISGMDQASLTYLIGELYRRLGDNDHALLWFSKVFSTNMAKSKIKEMAREQKYLIVEQIKKQKPFPEKPCKIENNNRKNLFGRLFSWRK